VPAAAAVEAAIGASHGTVSVAVRSAGMMGAAAAIVVLLR
jgi:hypothetical protein